MATYFGFAVADSMFPATCNVNRRPVTADAVKADLEGAIMAINPSHVPTIEAAKKRFGFTIEVPEKAPVVTLKSGDKVIVMSARGLPRLEGRHEYTEEEIAGATFAFGEWTVS